MAICCSTRYVYVNKNEDSPRNFKCVFDGHSLVTKLLQKGVEEDSLLKMLASRHPQNRYAVYLGTSGKGCLWRVTDDLGMES